MKRFQGTLVGQCLLLSVALFHARAASAATINVSSLSVSAVQSAINTASAGDIVVLPSGVATWSSTLQVNKAITLQGAGIDATIITSGGPQLMTLAASSKTQVTRITGFTINGNKMARGINVSLGGSLTEWGLYRIDHCKFKWCTAYDAVQVSSLAAGVVDHCRFQDNYLHFEVQASGSYSGGWWMDHSWQLPTSVGTTNCQVFEDNSFVRTAGGYTPFASSFENGQGCRLVFRYNAWTNFSSTSDQPIFDLHGNQGAPTVNNTLSSGANVRGNRNAEIYGNIFVASGAGGVKLYYRGGILICFSNAYIGSGFDMGWKMEEEDGPSRFGILSSYPGYDTHWAWIWSNYQNGVLQNTWYNAQGDSSAFLLSSNIWWAAPSGSATGDPDYFMGYYGWTGGRVSPPITGYTPLVYPHPLVKQGSGGQTNPIISISPVSGDHGTVAVGSTNDLTFRVRNIGGGTLAGTATVPAGPFSIWGGGSYSLGSHESQVITLRFTPVQAANTNQTVTFTGGGGASATVRGRTPP